MPRFRGKLNPHNGEESWMATVGIDGKRDDIYVVYHPSKGYRIYEPANGAAMFGSLGEAINDFLSRRKRGHLTN